MVKEQSLQEFGVDERIPALQGIDDAEGDKAGNDDDNDTSQHTQNNSRSPNDGDHFWKL